MDKLKMESKDNVQGNIEKIRELFPNCVTEVLRDGKPTLKVDFDVLKQEMSDTLIDDKEERYQFTWPDKKKSILLANTPIKATLRPCKEESVDFDNTENLYIEGDNLDVLKLLQETYLGKIKMIYIDPPYNTGNDFVYNDDFALKSEEYLESSGQYDEQGNRLVQNTESNGRFHTDWLNMIYPRLKVAKDLLSDDGAIFISIDDNEVENLRKICDEIFGEKNFVATLAIENNPKGRKNGKYFSINNENCLVFVKDYNSGKGFNDIIPKENLLRDEMGFYSPGQRVLVGKCSNKLAKDVSSDKFYFVYYKENCPLLIKKSIDKSLTDYKLYMSVNDKGEIIENTYTADKLKDLYNENSLIFNANTIYEKDRNINKQQKTLICSSAVYDLKTESANFIYEGFDLKNIFTMPKNVDYIKMLLKLNSDKNDIVLDFFSGSSTTAHAVMQLNAEDGGNREFIMVQLPEKCDENSEAFKAGYKNICEIGKERIRRAGKKIKEENGLTAQNLDIGFRVLKLDSSNMKDVYYKPQDYTQNLLDSLESNIKEDRTPLDLLFQVMLSLGKPLSAKIEEKEIAGKHVYIVNDDDLIACFDDGITEEVVKEIAKKKPLFAVFRDSGLSSDSTSTNFDQIFATYSPNTTRKVL